MLLSFLLWFTCNTLYAETLSSQEEQKLPNQKEQTNANENELQPNQDELEPNSDQTLDICIFEDLPMHNEMTNFIGQLVLKLIQTTLTQGSGYIKKLINNLDYKAASNQILRQRLQLYGQQTEEIDKSPLLLLTNFKSPADLSVLMHFFDTRVPLQEDPTAILPKLAKLYENVLSALHANPYKPTPEDKLIEETLKQNGLPLMNNQLDAVLATFLKDYENNRKTSSDKEFRFLSENSTCEAETQFVNIYTALQTPKFELHRLAKAMLITVVVLNQNK